MTSNKQYGIFEQYIKLKDMKLPYQMWRITKYVDDFLNTYKPPKEYQFADWIMKMYSDSDEKPSAEVVALFKQAIDEGFLEDYGPDGSNKYLDTRQNIRIGRRGRRLLDSFCGIPFGLLNETVREYGLLLSTGYPNRAYF